MRTIGAVTVGRSDYGIYVPVMRRIQDNAELELRLWVSGAHLAPEFGFTVAAIEADGFAIHDRVEIPLSSDTPVGIATAMGAGITRFAQAFARSRPDILLVLGDRFEMFAAAAAALPFGIPLAHIHGGESTEGAIDEALRHSITKMSHLHFVATETYARRLIRMGEEPWRVLVSGAPGLDQLHTLRLLDRTELERRYDVPPAAPFLLVTYHPVTTQYERVDDEIAELLGALEPTGLPVVFTYPNADTGSRSIIRALQKFVGQHSQAVLLANLGTQAYFSFMQFAAAMVGNSSSGIIEAASFRLPVVNIGPRQGGRLRAKNVIDVACAQAEIHAGIRRALSAEFRASLVDLDNPFGDGHAAERIVRRLKDVQLDARLLQKRFHES